MAQGPTNPILVTIWITVRIQESEVRNPCSLDYRITMQFYGELGYGLDTNWLHFGDNPHHCPDLGVRSVSRSGSRKNCHYSIMLVFGGGLYSLSTSSFNGVKNDVVSRYMYKCGKDCAGLVYFMIELFVDTVIVSF